MDYEPVIGLEVHAELDTDTKLFCGCQATFGADPNTRTCQICLGMPGTLPVMNRKAFEYVLRASLALNCKINRRTTFDRKNYYYPDLPKNYQISQDIAPVGVDGEIIIPVDGEMKRVRIVNVHIEEDAGKLLHPEDSPRAGSLVDLNRAGVPLAEIVTAPDMRNVEEVESFMETLRNILLYTGVSDCKMQEGSLRFEASVSLRPVGEEKLGNRVEIKNLNSMSAVIKALRFEIERQAEELNSGGKIDQETRLWHEEEGRSARMRSKEFAHDYRYFPEPDLVPVEISEEYIEKIRQSIPELPALRAKRFIDSHKLSRHEARILTSSRSLADFFERCLELLNEPRLLSNWISNQLLAIMNQKGVTPETLTLKPEHFAGLMKLVSDGTISAKNAVDILPELLDSGRAPEEIVEERGLKQISGSDELEQMVEQVISENTKAAEDCKAGKKQALNALLGGVMRLTKGRANPGVVKELIEKKLGIK